MSCEERNRLAEMSQKTQQELCELEEKLGRLLVSPNQGVARKAKNDIETARRRAGNGFMALMNHQQKHGCGPTTANTQADG